jgi:hypothetical protein
MLSESGYHQRRSTIVRGYVDVCTELLDEALHNSHSAVLGCDKHRRKSISISLVDVCAKFLDEAPHCSHLPPPGCHAQGWGALDSFFDVGTEIFDKTPQYVCQYQWLSADHTHALLFPSL